MPSFCIDKYCFEDIIVLVRLLHMASCRNAAASPLSPEHNYVLEEARR